VHRCESTRVGKSLILRLHLHLHPPGFLLTSADARYGPLARRPTICSFPTVRRECRRPISTHRDMRHRHHHTIRNGHRSSLIQRCQEDEWLLFRFWPMQLRPAVPCICPYVSCCRPYNARRSSPAKPFLLMFQSRASHPPSRLYSYLIREPISPFHAHFSPNFDWDQSSTHCFPFYSP
jgi:hypothetical protein